MYLSDVQNNYFYAILRRIQNDIMPIENIIFDLGGVLIDWNPRYLYRKIFKSDQEINYFLNHVATFAWNEEQDGGRSLEEATKVLVHNHPEYEKQIRLYYSRWEEMLGGAIQESVTILKSLHLNNGHRLLALTNWSQETFPRALEIFDFLKLFEGIVVSGVENIKKPDKKIYNLICDRYELEPGKSYFIDDNFRNIEAAKEFGFQVHHFQTSAQLREDLKDEGITL